MFKKAAELIVDSINYKLSSNFKDMLRIYDNFDCLFTPSEIEEFMNKNNLELKINTERSDYRHIVCRYFIYDNNMKTDTVAFYYEIDRETLTIDISKVYVWPGFDEEYSKIKLSKGIQ